MEKYLVVTAVGNSIERATDHYKVFADGATGEENKAAALAFYAAQITRPHTQSANLCLIVESTDYF